MTRQKFTAQAALILGACGCFGLPVAPAAAASADAQFKKQIKPVLQDYCRSCHNDQRRRGSLSLDEFPDLAAVRARPAAWLEIQKKLRSREMPPEDEDQPTDAQRDLLIAWIDAELFPVDCNNPDPGRVTIRRLNRVEYANTVRDLTGVSFNPARDFPPDDSGYGFDNIGDALSMSPLLLERYLAAAEQITEAALADPRTRGGILTRTPGPGTTNECVRAVIGQFARRAFRRPVGKEELDRLAGLANQALQDGAGFEAAVKITLQAILVSPHFLFRGELHPAPNDPKLKQPVDEYALASRLSYFIWSSMPDEELFALAEKGRLRKNLEAQTRRMIQDKKSAAFVENFAGQWLQLRNLHLAAPDRQSFPAFDEGLRSAMTRETELLFEHILRQDRSILEFLTADYSFVNERLARHYGLKNFPGSGPEFRRVSLVDSPRRGVLTHASVLTLTSNPTRTSPVKRGKWVLDNVLAQPPPPPPANVPPLNEAKEASATATLRQRTELHRQDPLCASCHAQMDPIGFSLEHYDGIGAWRDQDGSLAIDASGKLKTGESFDGATELLAILADKKRADFARCLVEKTLTYALGRGLEYYDRCAVDTIVGELGKNDFRFSALVLGVVRSVPFQMRRGEGTNAAQSR